MSGTAVIVDYGVGNLRSVARAVAACGSEPVLASNAAKIDRAEKIILPGVGAFASCVEALDAHSLKEPVLRAMNDNRPILGICVGMQMLLDKSEEFGEHAGLGRIAGSVVAIPREGVDGVQHKIPHVGWSPLQPSGAGWKGTILEGIEPGSNCYFVHSFSARPERSDVKLAVCDYDGIEICAAVRTGNLYGVQFHPEKSGPVGLRIFNNFLSLPAA
jgi:glutamine amidotransferase